MKFGASLKTFTLKFSKNKVQKPTEMAAKIAAVNGKMYLVGGAVRDEMLGKKPKDKDYCVIGLTSEEFQELFPEAELQGQDFPVFRMKVDGETTEIALARVERKQGAGHKGFSVQTSKEITIKDDLIRRDITINAMAKDVLTGEIIDFFGGREHLKRGFICATSDAFSEDPLRVYRVARFAARYGFYVDYNTERMMERLKDELRTVTSERVYEEIKKALGTKRPSYFFEALKGAGVLDVHLKPLSDLPIEAFRKSMRKIDAAAKITKNDDVKIAAVLQELPTEKEAENLCKALKFPKDWQKSAMFAVRHKGKMGNLWQAESAVAVTLAEESRRSPLGVQGLLELAKIEASAEAKKYPFQLFWLIAARKILRVKADPSLDLKIVADEKRSRQARQVEALKQSFLMKILYKNKKTAQ